MHKSPTYWLSKKNPALIINRGLAAAHVAFAGELPISFAVPGMPRHIAAAGPAAGGNAGNFGSFPNMRCIVIVVVCNYVCMYTCMCVYMYMHMLYIYIYTYMYIYTYICTRT